MKKGVKVALIGGFLAILIIVIGAIVGLKIYKGDDGEKDISEKEIYQHDVGEIVSNLSESKKLVKINATIETTEEKFLETLTNKNYIIRNEVNEIVRSKKEEAVREVDGQKNLQKQIVTRLNEVFNTKVISNVYFNDFIVQ